MKKFYTTFVFLFSSLLLFSSFAKAEDNLKEEKYKVSVQTFMEKTRIENSLKKIDGIDDAFVSLESKTLTVNFDEKKVNPEKFIKVIEEMEIAVEKIKTEDKFVKEKKQNSPR